jgi:hypothetical protein
VASLDVVPFGCREKLMVDFSKMQSVQLVEPFRFEKRFRLSADRGSIHRNRTP